MLATNKWAIWAQRLSLCIAITITLTVIIYPHILSQSGHPNHLAAMLLFWTMSAGYIYGVGYVPKRRLFRWLFGFTACWIALAGSLYQLANW